jgi:hypothetical protein
MGIRFKSSTWRAPLRLIDNFLPALTAQEPISAQGPSRALQAFVRAGWMNLGVRPSDATIAVPDSKTPKSIKACNVRVLRASDPASASSCQDMRLVISGRIGDVCAELDRLAALEQSTFLRRI